ncbi:SURF1 family protein [Intrasporangium sp.]|uniref:SURF1 family protein n=1 Tax=Intrasporangium sp. TaxID=1925024 RepID=UPI003221B11B
MSAGLVRPRWIGLVLVLAVVVTACTLLGLWQLGVAQDKGRAEAVAAAASLPREPLGQVTRPHSAFEADFSNRRVIATGTYAAADQILVVDRRLDGRTGSWVVTPLQTAQGTVAVLRGFVAGTPARPPAPPAGTVEVLGTLGPGESPRVGSGALPEPQRQAIDLAALVNEWPGQLYNVVLLASSESADGTALDPAATGLTRVPPPELPSHLNLRNAAYAVQWWAFGLFAVWMFAKIIRAEWLAQRRPVAPKEEAHA